MNSDPSHNPPRPSAPAGSIPPKIKPKKSFSFIRVAAGTALGVILVVATINYLEKANQPRRAAWTPQRERNVRWSPSDPDLVDEGRSSANRLKVVPEKVTGPRALPPEFSQPPGVYQEELTVEIKPGSAAGTIRYTLDGTEPTEASPVYSGPIPIASTTLVKAKAYESGVAPSVTAANTYTLVDANLAGFNSNLPLVILNGFGQQISKEESVTISMRVIEPNGERTTLTGNSGYDGPCDIKFRGHSSLRFPKRSFTIKTRTSSGEAAPVPILGMPEDSDWVLYAPYSDKTLMRDVLAYELSNRMGRWAARTRYVEVFLNRSGGKLSKRDYMGVYVFEEKIKRSPERVNLQPLTAEDTTEPNISGGYVFKRDHSNPPMDSPFGMSDDGQGFHSSRGVHLFFVDPKEENLAPAQRAYLSRYFSQLERALHGPNFKSPTEGYAKYLDVDSFIDQFWIVELSKNVDGFRYSCYMSKDRGGKIKLEPIWDWNLSFGNANYHQGWMPERWYWRLLRENEISWYKRLSQDPEFVQRVTDRWAGLRRGLFSPEFLHRRIDEIAQQLAEPQKRNFQRWPILGQSVNPNWFVGDTYKEEVDWMKRWIEERIAWIDSQFVSAPAISGGNGARAGGDIQLEALNAEIYFTLDGSDPRSTGGSLSPKAQPYTQPISLHDGQRLFARARAGERWSGPTLLPQGNPDEPSL